MKNNEKEAINKLNNILEKLPRTGPAQEIKNNVQIITQGLYNLDQEVKQKEQLLVQQEKELVRLKSITDNSSKVARDIISESKSNLDQAVSLHKSGNFSEALKYSDIALYTIGDINSFEVKGVEQANKLYLERKQQHVEAAAKRDSLYNSSVVSSGNKSVNAFAWVKDNPTRDFYTFFREALNIPDKEQKSPDNVRIIKKLYEILPLYVEEAQRANYFYNEYNKYYDVKTKLEQVVNIHNIRAASSKGLKDYEEALKSCEIALAIDPKNLTLSNLKNAILQEKQVVEAKRLEEEKLLVSQTQEIEKLKELLSIKEVETQEKNKLLTQKGTELASKEKVLIDQHTKETEALKALLAQKELKHQELLARKDKEVKELEKVKNELLKKELFDILPQVYPSAKDSGYNKPFAEWDTSWWGKKVLDAGNFKEIERYLPELREKAAKFKEENLEKQAKELENAKRLQEENIKKEQLLSTKDKLLSDKEQRIEELKALIEQSKIEKEELLAKQELAVANKSHMKNQIIDGLKKEVNLKENEVVDLRIQNLEKELITQEKEKLLIQKESELADKSFAKNQVIGELQEDIGLKEKEALNLKIELLMKQVEFHKKESELKDKALEDAHEIVKQNKIINELQEKLLTFQNLCKHDETLQLEFSVIHYKVEESIANAKVDDMKELSKYLSQLIKNSGDKDESLEISELLNLSPIGHVEAKIVQNPLAVINNGNFDIDNQHITHSVLISGEDSFSIIKDDVSH